MQSAGNEFSSFSLGALPCTFPCTPVQVGRKDRDEGVIAFSHPFQISLLCVQQLTALGVKSSSQQLPIQQGIKEISLSLSFQQLCREVSVSYSLLQFFQLV